MGIGPPGTLGWAAAQAEWTYALWSGNRRTCAAGAVSGVRPVVGVVDVGVVRSPLACSLNRPEPMERSCLGVSRVGVQHCCVAPSPLSALCTVAFVCEHGETQPQSRGTTTASGLPSAIQFISPENSQRSC